MAQFDAESDVVVVGGGGSGKSAAYTVASESDLSVCILEKLPETGGSSMFAEGTAASESCEQIARKIPDYPGELPEGAHFPTHREHYQRYIDYSHHRANPDVVKSFVWNSGETIEILKSIGVEYTDVTIYAFDQPYELYTFHRPEGLGAHVQELFLRACENAGVDIFVNTPAKELIVEDGKIVGVLATDADGNEMKVGAKAVILAGGGFGNNRELIAKYSWMPWVAETTFQPAPIENTGDGLKMALSVGGATRNIGALMIGNGALNRMPGSLITGAGIQPVLWLNSEGKRYANEIVAMSFADSGNTVAQRLDGVQWTIFDQEQFDHLVEDGSDIGLGDFICYHQKLTHLQAEFDEILPQGDGSLAKADNFEDLAKQMGLPVEDTVASIERYNELCEAGDDEDFFKPAEYMRAIKKPPFYGIRQAPLVLVSSGGIYVNGNFQVCTDNYKPVCSGNLYAVGNEASGLYGDTYNLDCPGTANGFAHTSGRVAARHAIKQIQG